MFFFPLHSKLIKTLVMQAHRNEVVPFYFDEHDMKERKENAASLDDVRSPVDCDGNFATNNDANRNIQTQRWKIFYVESNQDVDSYQVHISNSLNFFGGVTVEKQHPVQLREENITIFIKNLHKLCEFEMHDGTFTYMTVTDISPLHLAIMLEYPDVVRHLCKHQVSTRMSKTAHGGMPSSGADATCCLKSTFNSFEKLPENDRTFYLTNLTRFHLEILQSGGDCIGLAAPVDIENCCPRSSIAATNCLPCGRAAKDLSPSLSLEMGGTNALLRIRKEIYGSMLAWIWGFATEERAGLIFLLYFVGPFVAATMIVPSPSSTNVLSGQLLSVMIIYGVTLFLLVQLIMEPLIHLTTNWQNVCDSFRTMLAVLKFILLMPILLGKLIILLIILVCTLICIPAKSLKLNIFSFLFDCTLPLFCCNICNCEDIFRNRWQLLTSTDYFEQAPIHTAFKMRNKGTGLEMIQVLVENSSSMDFDSTLKYLGDPRGVYAAKQLTTEEKQRSPEMERIFLADEINTIIWSIWQRDADQEQRNIMIKVARHIQDCDTNTFRNELFESSSLRTNTQDPETSLVYWKKTHFLACFLDACQSSTNSLKSNSSADNLTKRYLKFFSNYLVAQIAIQQTELEAAKFFLTVFQYVCGQKDYYEDKNCLFRFQDYLQAPACKWISICLCRAVKDHPAHVLNVLERLFIPQMNLSRYAETNLFPLDFDPYSTCIADVLVCGSAKLWCKKDKEDSPPLLPIWSAGKLYRAWWPSVRKGKGLAGGKRSVVSHVLPLPGICSLNILKPLVTHTGVELFQTAAMRAVTEVLWDKLKLKICLLFFLYLVLVVLYSGFAIYCLGAGLDIKTFSGSYNISNSSVLSVNSTFFRESNETLNSKSNISFSVLKNHSFVAWKNISVISALNLTISKLVNNSLQGSHLSSIVGMTTTLATPPNLGIKYQQSSFSAQIDSRGDFQDLNITKNLSIQNRTLMATYAGNYSHFKEPTSTAGSSLQQLNTSSSALQTTTSGLGFIGRSSRNQSNINGIEKSSSSSNQSDQYISWTLNGTLSSEIYREIESYVLNQTISKSVNITMEETINQTIFEVVNHTLQKSVNKSLSSLINITQNSTTAYTYKLDLSAAWAFFISLFAAQVLNAFFLLRAVVQVSKTASGTYSHLISEPWNLIMLVTQSMVTASLTMFAVGVSNEDLRLMSSVTILLLWFCLLNYLKYFEAVSFLVELLVAITYEVLPFFIVVGNVMVGFTIAYIVVLKKPEDPSQYFIGTNSTISDVSYEFLPVIFNLVQISEGRLGYDGLNLSRDYSKTIVVFAECMFIFLTIAITIVCLSALISIMNSTYEKVMENQSALRHRQKMLLCLDEMEMMWDWQRKSFEAEMEWIYILTPSSDRCNIDKGLDLWEGKYGHRWSGHLQSMKRELDYRMKSIGEKIEKYLRPDKRGTPKSEKTVPSDPNFNPSTYTHSLLSLEQIDDSNGDELLKALHTELFGNSQKFEEYNTWLE